MQNKKLITVKEFVSEYGIVRDRLDEWLENNIGNSF